MERDGETPLATPNIMPSENIQETLYEAQEKLGKLDIIDNSVNNLQATKLNLETRTKTLEGSSSVQRKTSTISKRALASQKRNIKANLRMETGSKKTSASDRNH